jgi:hypothetical protein
MSRPLITDMTTQELIEKVTDIYEIEHLMKLERAKPQPTRALSDMQDRHLAMNEALPDQETSNLLPMIQGMARDKCMLRRLTAELTLQEKELQTEIESMGWKKTNGQESRRVMIKRATVEECQAFVKKKAADVAERQKFFDYVEDTDRKINELDDAIAGRAPTPAWFQMQLDAEYEAKREACRRSFEEYERSVREKRPYEPTS